jgi:hypothetical protein
MRRPPSRWLRIKSGQPMPKPWRRPKNLGPSKRYRRRVFTLFEVETYGLSSAGRIKPVKVPLRRGRKPKLKQDKKTTMKQPPIDWMREKKPEHSGGYVARKTTQRPQIVYIKSDNNPVLVCECGNRYLQTRRGQTVCLRCISLAANGGDIPLLALNSITSGHSLIIFCFTGSVFIN